MLNTARKILAIAFAPALCLSVLGGMVVQARGYLRQDDFEPFHARIRMQVDALPKVVDNWMGVDAEIPAAAQKLLRPNAIRAIQYTDTRPGFLDSPRQVLVVMVQCRVSGDMVGHYPPNCYQSQGVEMQTATPRQWMIDGQDVPGTEYGFVRRIDRQSFRTIVYNFLVVPREGIYPDIQGVRSAAEDYQQRYYGAAQVQVVFAGAMADLSQSERDEIFTTLMRPASGVIQSLKAGDLAP